MLRVLILLVVVIGLASVGCKKEPIPEPPVCCDTIYVFETVMDTVFPNDYLITYPGNWWKYSNGTKDSCFGWEEVTFVELEQEGDSVFITESTKILPAVHFRGNDGHIDMGDLIITAPDSEYSERIFLVDEDTGIVSYSYTTGDAHHGTYSSTRKVEVVEKLDSMTVNDLIYYDVVHVLHHSSTYYSHLSNGPTTDTHRYFAKGVGMIQQESFGPYSIGTWHIDEYHVQ